MGVRMMRGVVGLLLCLCLAIHGQESGHNTTASLQTFYDDTGGSLWTSNEGWLVEADPCDWFGIVCSRTQVIEAIMLPDNNLVGTLSDALSQITTLQHIILTDNRLRGAIPSSLFTLPSLNSLLLGENGLEGPLPNSISSATSLKILDVNTNDLFGQVPSFGQLQQIESITLSDNDFEGSLPPLNSSASIKYLAFERNAFSGAIPQAYLQYNSLQTLNLSRNQLDGEITNLDSLKNLISFDVSHNQFTGSFPSLGNTTRVYEINLSYNKFSGKIPKTLAQLPLLTDILANNNTFTGEVPSFSFSVSPLLKNINLSGNLIMGSIPSSISSITWLSSLILNDNQLSGTLPVFLQTQPSYTTNLAHNRFRCPLPQWCSSLGNSLCTPCYEVDPTPTATPSIMSRTAQSSNQEDSEGRFPWGVVMSVAIVFVIVVLLVLSAALVLIYKKYYVRRFLPLAAELESDDAL